MGLKDNKRSFGVKRLVRSFFYAFRGIGEAFIGEQNIRIHVFCSLLVLLFGAFFNIDYFEWIVVLMLIGLVIMAEFFNTAIEHVTDICSPNICKKAKFAKDISAAAVLVIALVSFIIGLIIFVPKIILFVGGLL